MNGPARLALLAVVVSSLLACAPARAGTLSVEDFSLVYVGAPGEVNTVTIDSTRGTFRDETATMVRGAGCFDPTPGEDTADDDRHALRCSGGYVDPRGRVDLGDGADSYSSASVRSLEPGTVAGGDGDDVITVSDFAETVTGGDGADTITQASGDGYGPGTTLDGGPGNDRVAGSSVRTRLIGGDGDDHLLAGASGTYVGWAIPTIQACNGFASSQGPLFTPTLDGGPGNDRLEGSRGDDLLAAGDGVDILTGGDGNDTLSGGTGGDTLDGGAGSDSLLGDDGDDRLSGGDGGQFGDSLVGGGGNDVIVGGPGYLDKVCYGDRPQGVTIDLRRAGGNGTPGESDTISEVEIVFGSNHADMIHAGEGALIIEAGAGDDTVTGGPSPDQINGGTGVDVLDGAEGDDRVRGGSYRDDEGDELRGGVGSDTLVGTHGDDLIVGGDGSDHITGEKGDDWIDGGRGDDFISAVEAGGVNHSPIVSLVHGDQVWCGSGDDQASADYADGVGADCELAAEGSPRWRVLRVGRRGVVSVKARCAWHESVPCRGTATVVAEPSRPSWQLTVPVPASYLPIAAAGVGPPNQCRPLTKKLALGKAKFNLRAGRVGIVTVKLSKKGLAVLRRRGCVPSRISIPFTGPGRIAYGSSRTFSLTAAGSLRR